MRTQFVTETLNRLLQQGVLTLGSRIVAVCASRSEHELFTSLGFHQVTITNLDAGDMAATGANPNSAPQNAMNLSFADKEFDFAFVSDGLHHCSSPHQALLEMYRVARHGVLVFESRDSVLMRAAVRLGLTMEYETATVAYHGGQRGGVNDSHIPNFVYRWTEREFEKTLSSHNPTGPHQFLYFYGLNLNPDQFKTGLRRHFWKIINLIMGWMTVFVKSQCNSFAMIALKPKPGQLWPWLEFKDEKIRFRM